MIYQNPLSFMLFYLLTFYLLHFLNFPLCALIKKKKTNINCRLTNPINQCLIDV